MSQDTETKDDVVQIVALETEDIGDFEIDLVLELGRNSRARNFQRSFRVIDETEVAAFRSQRNRHDAASASEIKDS